MLGIGRKLANQDGVSRCKRRNRFRYSTIFTDEMFKPFLQFSRRPTGNVGLANRGLQAFDSG